MVLLVRMMPFALLAGCSFIPEYERPDAGVPQVYAAQADEHASAAETGWQDFFAEPELHALIAQALEHNADIHMAAARVEQARAGLKIRGADLAPSLASSRNFTAIGAPSSLERFLGDDTQTSFSAMLQASWEIDLFGRLRSLREAALQTYLSSEAAHQAVSSTVIAQVAAGYLADRAYAQRIDVARAGLANREQSLAILQRQEEVGTRSRLEVISAETLKAQAEAEIQALELQRRQNLNALQLLTGQMLDGSSFSASLDSSGLERPIPAGLPSDLLLNRPDIIAAEHSLLAQNADIGAARAAFFPSISLTGIAGSTSDDLAGLFDSDNRLWLVQPGISLPIFTAGKLKGQLELEKAQRDEAVAQYQQSIQSAFRDVSDALAQRQWLAAQIDTAERNLAHLEERARLSHLRYDLGKAAYLEVLDAERDLFSAQQQLLERRSAWLTSGVSLYAALGGGISTKDTQDETQ